MTEDFIQENEDRELFRRIKQGSEEAFRVVYGKYHRILYAVALKMLKDRSRWACRRTGNPWQCGKAAAG